MQPRSLSLNVTAQGSTQEGTGVGAVTISPQRAVGRRRGPCLLGPVSAPGVLGKPEPSRGRPPFCDTDGSSSLWQGNCTLARRSLSGESYIFVSFQATWNRAGYGKQEEVGLGVTSVSHAAKKQLVKCMCCVPVRVPPLPSVTPPDPFGHGEDFTAAALYFRHCGAGSTDCCKEQLSNKLLQKQWVNAH